MLILNKNLNTTQVVYIYNSLYKMQNKESKIEKRYNLCKRSFVALDEKLYPEYQNMAYEDLDSSKKEENLRWKITKAYQALFLMCNSLLVKKLGFYTKDHDCLIIALLHNDLIPGDVLQRIKSVFSKREAFSELDMGDAFFRGVSEIRIARNNYLYLPKTLRKTKTAPEQIIDEVKELIKLIGEI